MKYILSYCNICYCFFPADTDAFTNFYGQFASLGLNGGQNTGNMANYHQFGNSYNPMTHSHSTGIPSNSFNMNHGGYIHTNSVYGSNSTLPSYMPSSNNTFVPSPLSSSTGTVSNGTTYFYGNPPPARHNLPGTSSSNPTYPSNSNGINSMSNLLPAVNTSPVSNLVLTNQQQRSKCEVNQLQHLQPKTVVNQQQPEIGRLSASKASTPLKPAHEVSTDEVQPPQPPTSSGRQPRGGHHGHQSQHYQGRYQPRNNTDQVYTENNTSSNNSTNNTDNNFSRGRRRNGSNNVNNGTSRNFSSSQEQNDVGRGKRGGRYNSNSSNNCHQDDRMSGRNAALAGAAAFMVTTSTDQEAAAGTSDNNNNGGTIQQQQQRYQQQYHRGGYYSQRGVRRGQSYKGGYSTQQQLQQQQQQQQQYSNDSVGYSYGDNGGVTFRGRGGDRGGKRARQRGGAVTESPRSGRGGATSTLDGKYDNDTSGRNTRQYSSNTQSRGGSSNVEGGARGRGGESEYSRENTSSGHQMKESSLASERAAYGGEGSINGRGGVMQRGAGRGGIHIRSGVVKLSLVSRGDISTDDDGNNQREELMNQLLRGTYECMVCCDRVRPQQAIWSCRKCFNCFHLGCIKKWATSSKEGGGGYCGYRDRGREGKREREREVL